ncbi:MAG: hypothetical protein ACJ748_14775 [Flavisolibacter sp.]
MYESEIENFKNLPFDERVIILDKLIAEVKNLKKKVNYDEGPVIPGRTFRQSSQRKEWEEKEKLMTILEKIHHYLIEGGC